MSKRTQQEILDRIKEVKFLQIVENEWREQYDREWGLGIVTSVDQGDGYVWVAKIEKDKDGYFVVPMAVICHKDRLRETKKQLTNLQVELRDE